MSSLDTVLEIIDQINAQDPRMTGPEGTAAVPADLLRGFRMSLVCKDFAPLADDLVKIAARGQRLESWLFEKQELDDDETEDSALVDERKRRHSADRIARIMATNGYDDHDCAIVHQLLEGKADSRDGRLQLLDDLNGLVFLRFHATELHQACDEPSFKSLLEDCLSGMSDEALYHALDQIDDPSLAEAIRAIRSNLRHEKRAIVYLD